MNKTNTKEEFNKIKENIKKITSNNVLSIGFISKYKHTILMFNTKDEKLNINYKNKKHNGSYKKIKLSQFKSTLEEFFVNYKTLNEYLENEKSTLTYENKQDKIKIIIMKHNKDTLPI